MIGGINAPLFCPTDPFRDAIQLVAGGLVPPDYVQGWACAPEDTDRLQAWLASHMELTGTPWATGIGALEAAELIVAEAISNGNIWHPDDKRWGK